MTNLERKIIRETLEEHREIMQYYYEEGRKTGDWKNHEKACASLRSISELANSLGVQS